MALPDDYADFGDSSQGVVGERWYRCERCDFIYPASETVIEDLTGRRVCIAMCLDTDPSQGANNYGFEVS